MKISNFKFQNYANKFGLTLLELLITLILLIILGFAVYQTLDPVEQEKVKRDDMYSESAKTLLDALNRYIQKYGRIPWQTKDLSASLDWTRVNDPKIAVCANTECTQEGALLAERYLGSSFKSAEFLTSANENNALIVGKGIKETDKTYVCFLPTSRHYRLNWVEMKEINIGDSMPLSGEPKECYAQPDWENNYCYFCASSNMDK